MNDLKQKIRTIPDFPAPGILFRDITTLLADPAAFNGLKAKQTKIIIGLLDRLSTSSENDSLIDILEGVLDLNKEQMDEFASQISKSKLDWSTFLTFASTLVKTYQFALG